MGDAAKRRATYDDLIGVPENLVAEIFDGELHTEPRPGPAHVSVTSALGGELHGPFRRGIGGPGGWIILDEPEIHMHGDVLVPDLAGWRCERMPVLPDTAYFELAPAWVCEVLSPSTAKKGRGKKLPIYAREGVSYAWIVDPRGQTLEAYQLERERWVLLGTWSDDAKVRVKPFDAIELDLSVLWAR